MELGVNFFDTADVYGDGRSERLLARLRSERGEQIHIATKAGRRLDPHVAEGYNRANLTAFVERSLKNLETDALDLLQLHCPPTEVYYMPEVFGVLDDLVQAGKLRYYGVSVEKVEEALKAIEYPNVQTVQIIFNIFRQRPAELFFEQAKRRKVGILARVPLASGHADRQAEAASPPSPRTTTAASTATAKPSTAARPSPAWITTTGLQAVEELRPLCPPGMSLAQFALRWILMFDGGHLRHPRRQTPRPGGRELLRRRPAAAFR